MTGETMKVNLNKMSLNSVNAFFSINGKFSAGEKDSYFLRFIGYDDEKKDMENLLSCEQRFIHNIPLRKAGYYRTDRLPFNAAPDDICRYNQALGKLEASGQSAEGLGIKFAFESPFLNYNHVAAFHHVLNTFRQIAPHSSQSIIKNFTVKLLYWMDNYLPKLFPEGFTPAASPKFVFHGTIKLQEYMFLYLLTQLGCDVLYLETEKDVDLPARCQSMSQICRGTKYGVIQIPPFNEDLLKADAAPNLTSVQLTEPARSVQSSPSPGQPVHIPPRSSTPAGSSAQHPPMQQASSPVQSSVNRQPIQAANHELAYEALAMKAASVVMIEVIDQKGECFKSGSGVMIGRNGYILTNFHVINGGAAFLIRVETEERAYQTSHIIKYNDRFDLAVLQIDRLCDPIPICRNQKLIRGQKVVAIGSPLGLFNSVSDGIISAFRSVRDVPMIQFTAPISSGSSGGAVLNMYGELIGLSTAGFDDGQNLNLAVGYETIRAFVGGLIG